MTEAHQTPLPMEFSRQKYWSGLPSSSPEDLPDPGIELGFPALQADSLPTEPPVFSQSCLHHGIPMKAQATKAQVSFGLVSLSTSPDSQGEGGHEVVHSGPHQMSLFS